MNLSHLPALTIVLPLFSACLCAIFVNTYKVCKAIFLVTILAIFFVSLFLVTQSSVDLSQIYKFGNWSTEIGISLYTNVQSLMMLLIISTGLVISGIGAIKSDQLPTSRMCFYLIAFGGLAGLCLTADFFSSYVFIELSSIACCIMTGLSGKKNAYKVAFDYLLMSSFAGALFLIGVLGVYASIGSLSMITLSKILSQSLKGSILTEQNTILLKFSYFFMIASLLLKAGFYPMHSLVIKTYRSSAGSVSSFLAGNVGKTFCFLAFKISTIFVLGESTIELALRVASIIIVIGVFGIIINSFRMFGEKDLKTAMSVSSCMQISYFLIGLFSFNNIGITGAMVQMFLHAISISTIFILMSSSFYKIDPEYTPKKPGETHTHLASHNGITKICFILLLLNIAGYPVTAGFFAKWMLLESMTYTNKILTFVALIFSGGLGMLYTFRIIEQLLFYKKTNTYKTKQKSILKTISIIVVVICATLGQLFLNKEFRFIGINGANFFNSINTVQEKPTHVK